MFFDKDDMSFEIVSVLNLTWKNRNAKAFNRPFHALSFRINGEAEFIYGKASTIVKSKDMIFVPKGIDYTLKTKKEELIVVHLTCESDLPQEIRRFTTETPQYFEKKFRELHAAWIKKQDGYKYECKSILYKILMTVEREIAEFNEHFDVRINEAIEYIHENFMSGEISVAALANMCNMSDTYFRKLFLNETSVTPSKYINDLRLKHAIDLLRSGYYRIQEVSDKCGFKTVNYFSTFIKKETGFSPTDLLKNI